MTTSSVSANYYGFGLNTNKNLSQTSNFSANTTSTLVKDKSEATSQILGYGVDSEGFFTSDFNEKVGLGRDYKIHSSSLTNYIKTHTSDFSGYTNIDIAQTFKNGYKVFSQLLGALNSKQSFTKEDLANLPQAYDLDKKSLSISKTYQLNAKQYSDYINNELAKHSPQEDLLKTLTFDSSTNSTSTPNNAFDNALNKAGADKYTNADGSVSKGGVFMAFMAGWGVNFAIREGQTNIWGKLNGLDESVSVEQRQDLRNFIEENSFDESLFERMDLLNANLSIEDFKTEWLKLKEQSNKMQANSTTQTAQNANANPNTNGIQNTTNSTNATQENTEQNTIKKRSPIQVTSKSEIYKDENLSRLQNILKNQHKVDLINILFGTNSNTSAFNANGTDLNTNLMNLNLSQIKPLSKVDIKA